MSKETMKLAQEWYDSGNENPDDFADMIKQVIALAEQPAQRTWVGLTEEETGHWAADFLDGAKWAEAKLREKNNG